MVCGIDVCAWSLSMVCASTSSRQMCSQAPAVLGKTEIQSLFRYQKKNPACFFCKKVSTRTNLAFFLSTRMLLLSLDPDALSLIVTAVHEDDQFPLALACTSLRDICIRHSDQTRTGNGPRWYTSGTSSLERLKWTMSMTTINKTIHVYRTKWCASAAENGCLPVLQWLRTNDAPWDFRTCAFAAKNGHLDILQWARTNDAPWNEMTCFFAALGGRGNLDILKWARANGCPWDDMTCAVAARTSRRVLMWARNNGCPWKEDTCAGAADAGRLDILKWARKHGCPWDENTCAYAAEEGHLDILKWARDNGCPSHSDDSSDNE